MSMSQTKPVSRRQALTQLAAVAAAFGASRALAQTRTPITVYKDANCGCCSKWVDHMDASGFRCAVFNSNMVEVHTKYKVPAELQSCHTAIIGAYVIEGHVPAGDVKKLLAQKPAGILGLTIPGMPQSAPGMDVVPFQPYTVLTFTAAGKTAVFSRHTKA
jgi:hypothetical protein